jgi:hypothetical protein
MAKPLDYVVKMLNLTRYPRSALADAQYKFMIRFAWMMADPCFGCRITMPMA